MNLLAPLLKHESFTYVEQQKISTASAYLAEWVNNVVSYKQIKQNPNEHEDSTLHSKQAELEQQIKELQALLTGIELGTLDYFKG